MVKTRRITDTLSIDETTEYVHIEIPQSYSLSSLIVSLVTLYLLYLKVLDNLLASWLSSFYIMFALLAIKFVISFADIIKESKLREALVNFYGDDEEVILKLENLTLLNNLFNLTHYSFCVFTCMFFAEFLDKKNDEYIFYFLNSLIGLISNQLIFSLLCRTKWFDIKSTSNTKLNDLEANGDTENNNSNISSYDSVVSFFASLITPLLTYFSNMMVICSANSGVCTQFYLSTLTSLLGAFGINVSNLSTYLFPITLVMLVISNISLYIKRRKLTHPPFLLGVFSTGLIILSKVFEDSLWEFNYVGSVLILVAAIWNARINKFFGLPTKKK